MLVVNLIGPPGASKSTMAAHIFAELKWKNINCELVTEFAKDLTWENRQFTLQNQIYVFAKQYHRINRLKGQVDVVVTDSPLILSIFYNNKYCNNHFECLNALVLEQHHKFNNYNIFINRVKPYNPIGRNQTEEESDMFGKEIMNLLDSNEIKYDIFNGAKENIDAIVNTIISKGGIMCK